jgi:lipoprotein NlpI
MRCWFWVAVAFLVIGQAGPAVANGNMDLADCFAHILQGDQDAALALCTRALQSGGLSASQTLNALNDRAAIYIGQGEYDLAMQDADQAIRLKPDDAHGYNNRGIAHAGKGEIAEAIQDFEQAIRLKPDDDSAYVGRAGAFANRGDYDRALQSFDQALQVDPGSTYAALWRAQLLFELARYNDAADALEKLVDAHPELVEGAIWLTLARWRTGHRTDDALKAQTQGRDLKEWPGPIARLYLGQISRDAVKLAAQNSKPKIARYQSCQAAFYIGELDLADGQAEAAKLEFQQAIDTCLKDFAFFRTAKAELGRI